VGIESLRFRTDWRGPFVHHASAEHDDGWNHVRFDAVENGWVRDTVHDGTTYAVMLASAKNCTVTGGRITGPLGHNGWGVLGAATNNLFTDLDGATAFHTYQIQGHPSGNAFTGCRSDEPSSVDGHGGLGVANLLDDLEGGVFRNGGSRAAVPPCSGRGLVFWNWRMGRLDPYNRREKPLVAEWWQIPGFVAVGVRGADGHPVYYEAPTGRRRRAAFDEPWGTVESPGPAVAPASLYAFQRARRLGGTRPERIASRSARA
jgi:hypothetical protein